MGSAVAITSVLVLDNGYYLSSYAQQRILLKFVCSTMAIIYEFFMAQQWIKLVFFCIAMCVTGLIVFQKWLLLEL